MGVPASGGFPGRARDPAEPQAEPLSPDSVKSETAGVPLGDMLPKLNQPKFLRRLWGREGSQMSHTLPPALSCCTVS